MCFALLGAAAAGGAGAATAAGATAAATTGLTFGQVLQAAGLVASIGGSIAQGNAVAQAELNNKALIEHQEQVERKLTGIEDQRTRQKYRAEIEKQTAELAARGVQLDSSTAVLLGETAAREMSFASQEVRSRGAATSTELSASARAAEARARMGLTKGRLSAAGSFFDAVPDLWPGLADRRILQ